MLGKLDAADSKRPEDNVTHGQNLRRKEGSACVLRQSRRGKNTPGGLGVEYPDKGVVNESSDKYDEGEGKKLSSWVHNLLEHAADGRRAQTRESQWKKDWDFISRNQQWEGPLPSYRRPITANIYRRGLHIIMAVLTGGRPLLKVIPQGPADPSTLEVWQHALWSVMKTEHIIDKWSDAIMWGQVGDGGWLKAGYGHRDILGKQPDVMVTAPHPLKIYPDPSCNDDNLSDCGYIIYRDILDIASITRRYKETGWRVEPERGESVLLDVPGKSDLQIASAGGWTTGKGMMRARATVLECWIDDPSLELVDREVPDDIDLNTGVITKKTKKEWVPKYPFGRVITVAKDVVLRDIPNPFGQAFGYEMRWPFVFVPGAEQPHVLWRPGLSADLAELQRGINKSLSLVLENSIKATNAIVIADESAMDDEDWDVLSLFPGVKIRKRQGTEVQIVFPQPLPAQAFQLPDYLIHKLEEVIGLHDPPISPGQAVAAKTVAFLQAKGHFLLGEMAKLAEEALERLGARIVGLQRNRYLPGRVIPLFQGETLKQPAESHWPEIPDSLDIRVEASSGYQEVLAQSMAQAAGQAQGKK